MEMGIQVLGETAGWRWGIAQFHLLHLFVSLRFVVLTEIEYFSPLWGSFMCFVKKPKAKMKKL